MKVLEENVSKLDSAPFIPCFISNQSRQAFNVAIMSEHQQGIAVLVILAGKGRVVDANILVGLVPCFQVLLQLEAAGHVVIGRYVKDVNRGNLTQHINHANHHVI